MTDYIKQLEKRNEELERNLSEYVELFSRFRDTFEYTINALRIDNTHHVGCSDVLITATIPNNKLIQEFIKDITKIK